MHLDRHWSLECTRRYLVSDLLYGGLTILFLALSYGFTCGVSVYWEANVVCMNDNNLSSALWSSWLSGWD